MDLRKRIMEAQSCAFHADITADYGDVLYSFQMDCITTKEGDLSFTVVEPETIAGITGTISKDKALLTFDDKILAFPMLADGQLAPVIAPWIFYHTLQSGYISGCSKDEKGTLILLDDSFQSCPLHMEIQTDQDNAPTYAEIFWNQRRILSLEISDFAIV